MLNIRAFGCLRNFFLEIISIDFMNYNLPREDADELIAADIIPPAAVGAEDVEERRRN